jgi:hypothetical protein
VIVAVVDVFDALTSKRPYKEAFSFEESFAFVRKNGGIAFDPRVADAFLAIESEVIEIKASYPAGITASTAENLKEAADGEKLEWGTLYPDFSKVAEDEGFKDIARTFQWHRQS